MGIFVPAHDGVVQGAVPPRASLLGLQYCRVLCSYTSRYPTVSYAILGLHSAILVDISPCSILLRGSGFRVQGSGFRLQTSDFRLQTSDSKCSTTFYSSLSNLLTF
eukprot:1150444-Rhodomonas_salina.1